MAIYYVAPGGTGINTNHWNTGAVPGDLETTVNNNPWLAPGDEIWALGNNNIWVPNGLYQINGTLIISVPNVSLYGGFNGRETLLSQRTANIDTNNSFYFLHPSILENIGYNQSVVMVHAENCLIDGFIIRNGISQNMQAGGLHAINSNNLRIENVVFRDNNGKICGGMYLENFHTVFLKNIVFYENRGDNRSGGLYMQNANSVHAINTIFTANTVFTPPALNSGSAIYVENSNEVKFINVTIADNFPQTANGIFLDNSGVELYNSIFYHSQIALQMSNAIIDYCLLSQPPLPVPGHNPNGLPFGTDPRFVNPNNVPNGYHLQLGNSPCIDAGDMNFVIPYATTDLEGLPRVVGANVDMGAFEVQ